MARPTNKETPFIRQCINLWFAGNKLSEFNVTVITNAIILANPVLQGSDSDVSKAVSNDLARRESIGILTSRKGVKGEGSGMGRPPRMYSKVFCKRWK